MTEFIRRPKLNPYRMPPGLQAQQKAQQEARLLAHRDRPPVVPILDHIDVAQWSVVPFVDERGGAYPYGYTTMRLAVPNTSGVYAVVDEATQVLYIGRSIRLQQRWKNHQLLPALRSPGKTLRIAYLLCPEAELYGREAALLKAYTPRLNTPWEIAKAIDPNNARMRYVSWGETPSLGKDRREAEDELREFGACSNPSHQQKYIVICTTCLYHVWCARCMPGDCCCDCWKYLEMGEDPWPWISMEAYDALQRGMEKWIETHPERSIWDLEKFCKARVGNLMQFEAFVFGLLYPSLYEAEILAEAFGTTLSTLERQREECLAMREIADGGR